MKKKTFQEQRVPKPNRTSPARESADPQTEHPSAESSPGQGGLASLHHHLGNRGVQRLLAQRSDQAPAEMDDETADRIRRARAGGQPLDASLQGQMSEAMGHDLSGVRVHTSPEADDLSHQLSAKAFTTGQDVFFREGAYEPGSSGGQELIAHELTHVVQQSTGAVGSGGGRMTVNAPGDAFEQEADAVAKAITGPGATAEVQRQEEEDENALQMQEMEEGEEEGV